MSNHSVAAGSHSGHYFPVTGTLAVQRGHVLFSGFVPIEDFKNFQADRLPKGYQRPAKPSRRAAIRRFYFDSANMMPNSLLVNLRNPLDELMERIEFVGNDADRVKKAVAEGGNCIVHVVLTLDEDEVKWLVDGQHRYEYFIKEILDNKIEDLFDMPIPVMFTLGLTPAQERQNFSFVNDEARGVPKGVSQANLTSMVEDGTGGFVRDSHGISEQDLKAGAVTGNWEYDGMKVIARLRQKSGVWGGKTILDLSEDLPHTQYIIQSPQFSRSLTPIVSGDSSGLIAGVIGQSYLSTDAVADLLAAYWEGIAKVYPEAFPSAIKDRKKYAIQKGQGVYPFHRLLPFVLSPFVNHYDAKAVYDSDKWAEFLAPVADIEFDLPDGSTAEGPDFWLSGQKGAAGSFSGDAGRKRLYLTLKHLLDEQILVP